MNKKRYLAIITNGTYIALFSALTFAQMKFLNKANTWFSLQK